MCLSVYRLIWRLRCGEAPAYLGRQPASCQLRYFGREFLVDLLQAVSAADAVADLTQKALVAPGSPRILRLWLRLVAVFFEAAGLPVLEALAAARHCCRRRAVFCTKEDKREQTIYIYRYIVICHDFLTERNTLWIFVCAKSHRILCLAADCNNMNEC